MRQIKISQSRFHKNWNDFVDFVYKPYFTQNHRLNTDITVINNIPSGKNINVDCGSMHPELLQKMIKVFGADLGLAYDGDAHRLIAVDSNGNITDGVI